MTTKTNHNPSFDLRVAAELSRLASLSKDLEEILPSLTRDKEHMISPAAHAAIQRLDELTQVLKALGVLFSDIGNNPTLPRETLLQTLELQSLAARLSAVPTQAPKAGEMIPL